MITEHNNDIDALIVDMGANQSEYEASQVDNQQHREYAAKLINANQDIFISKLREKLSQFPLDQEEARDNFELNVYMALMSLGTLAGEPEKTVATFAIPTGVHIEDNTILTEQEFLKRITNEGVLKLLNNHEKLLEKIIQSGTKNIEILNQMGINKMSPEDVLQALNLHDQEKIAGSAREIFDQDIQDGGERIYNLEIQKIEKKLEKLIPDIAPQHELKRTYAKKIFDTNAEIRVRNLIEKIEDSGLRGILLKQDLVKLDKLNINEAWIKEINSILAEKENNTKEDFIKKLTEKCSQLQIKIEVPDDNIIQEKISAFGEKLKKIKSNFDQLEKPNSFADLQGNLLSRNSHSIASLHKEFKELVEKVNEFNLYGNSSGFVTIHSDIKEINEFFDAVKNIFAKTSSLQTKLEEAKKDNDPEKTRHYQQELNILCQKTTQDNITYLANIDSKTLDGISKKYQNWAKENIIAPAMQEKFISPVPADAEELDKRLKEVEEEIKSGTIDLKTLDKLIASCIDIISANPPIAERIKSLIEFANNKVADAIFTKDKELFLNLKPEELSKIGDFSNEKICPGISAITHHVNGLIRTVVTQLLDSSHSPEQFILTLGRWIEVAYKLYKYNNNAADYCGVHALLSAFGSASIARLIGDIDKKSIQTNSSLASLPKSTLMHLSELSAIPRTNNMREFAAHMSRNKSTIIPYVGAYQSNNTVASEDSNKKSSTINLEQTSTSTNIKSMQEALSKKSSLNVTNNANSSWLSSSIKQWDIVDQDSFNQKTEEISKQYPLSEKQQIIKRNPIWMKLTNPLLAENIELHDKLDQLTEDKKIHISGEALEVLDRKNSLLGISGISDKTRDAFEKYLDYLEESIKAGVPDFDLYNKLINSPWGKAILAQNITKQAIKSNKDLVKRVQNINQLFIEAFVKSVNAKSIELIAKITETELVDIENHTNKERCPNIVELAKLQQDITNFFIGNILADSDPNKIVLNLDIALKCAYQFYLSKNYFALSALIPIIFVKVDSLLMQNNEPTAIFEGLSDEAKKYYNILSRPAKETRGLEKLAIAAQGVVIPLLDTVIRDITSSIEVDSKNFKNQIGYIKVINAFKSMQQSLEPSTTQPVSLEWLSFGLSITDPIVTAKSTFNKLSGNPIEINSHITNIIEKTDKNLAKIDNFVLRDMLMYSTNENISVTTKNITVLNEFYKKDILEPIEGEKQLKDILNDAGITILSETDFKNVYVEMQRLHVMNVWKKLADEKSKLQEKLSKLDDKKDTVKINAIKELINAINGLDPSTLSILSGKQTANTINAVKDAHTLERANYIIEQTNVLKAGLAEPLAKLSSLINLDLVSNNEKLIDILKNYIAAINYLGHERANTAKAVLEENKMALSANSEQIKLEHEKNLKLIKNSALRKALSNPASNNGYLLNSTTVDKLNNVLWDERFSKKDGSYPSDIDYLKSVFNTLKIELREAQIKEISGDNSRIRSLLDKISDTDFITAFKEPQQDILPGEELYIRLSDLVDLVKSIPNAAYDKLDEYKKQFAALKNAHLKAMPTSNTKPIQTYLKVVEQQINIIEEQLEKREKLLGLSSKIKNDELFQAIKQNKFGISIPNNAPLELLSSLADELNKFSESNTKEDLEKLFSEANVKVNDLTALYNELIEITKRTLIRNKIDKQYSSEMTKFLQELRQLATDDRQSIILTDKEIEEKASQSFDKKKKTKSYDNLIANLKSTREDYFSKISALIVKYKSEIIDKIKVDYKGVMPSTKDIGADEIEPIIKRILADSDISFTDMQAFENLYSILMSDEFVKYFPEFMDGPGAVFTGLYQTIESPGSFKTTHTIQHFANESYSVINSLVAKHENLLKRADSIGNSDRPQYMRELLDAKKNVVAKIKAIQEQIQHANKECSDLLGIYNRLDEYQVTIYETLEKAIVSLQEQVAKLKTELNNLTVAYDNRYQLNSQNNEFEEIAEVSVSDAEQKLYADNITQVIHSVEQKEDNQWKENESFKSKYNIHIHELNDSSKAAFHHTGSNGSIKVSDFRDEDAYNDARMEDFYERGLLCVKAAEDLASKYFASNQDLKDNLQAFLQARLNRFEQEVKANCEIDPKKGNLDAQFEEAYKNAVKIHKQLLIDIANSFINAGKETNTVISKKEVIAALREQEQVYLSRVGRPDIYHIYNAPDNKFEQIDVQTTLSKKTPPSHARKGLGPANFVKEIHAHKIKAEDDEVIKVDFVTYRGSEQPYEVKNRILRLAASEYNAERMLEAMINDMAAANPNILSDITANKMLNVNISSMILLSTWAGNKVRGKTNEVRMVKESVLAWRMLMSKQQPLKLKINGEDREVNVNINLAEMNMAVKPIHTGVISDIELNLNERGYYQFEKQVESFLGALKKTDSSSDTKLSDIQKTLKSIDNAYENSNELQEAIKQLQIAQNPDTSIKSEYQKFLKQQDKFILVLKFLSENKEAIEDIKNNNLKKNLYKYLEDYKEIIDDLPPAIEMSEEDVDTIFTDDTVDEKKLKALITEYKGTLKEIDETEAKLDKAYKAVNDAKCKIWANPSQQELLKQLKEEAIKLAGDENASESEKRYGRVIQEYVEAQSLFFDTNLIDRKVYNKKDNWYEFQARFIHIGHEIGNFTKFKCKSSEDRTGKLAEVIKARSIFEQNHGYLPRLGNAEDNAKLEQIMEKVEAYSVSRENTGFNAPGARGKQTGTAHEKKMAKLDKKFYSWTKLKFLNVLKDIKKGFRSSVKDYIEYIRKQPIDSYINNEALANFLEQAKGILYQIAKDDSDNLGSSLAAYHSALDGKFVPNNDVGSLSETRKKLEDILTVISRQVIVKKSDKNDFSKTKRDELLANAAAELPSNFKLPNKTTIAANKVILQQIIESLRPLSRRSHKDLNKLLSAANDEPINNLSGINRLNLDENFIGFKTIYELSKNPILKHDPDYKELFILADSLKGHMIQAYTYLLNELNTLENKFKKVKAIDSIKKLNQALSTLEKELAQLNGFLQQHPYIAPEFITATTAALENVREHANKAEERCGIAVEMETINEQEHPESAPAIKHDDANELSIRQSEHGSTENHSNARAWLATIGINDSKQPVVFKKEQISLTSNTSAVKVNLNSEATRLHVEPLNKKQKSIGVGYDLDLNSGEIIYNKNSANTNEKTKKPDEKADAKIVASQIFQLNYTSIEIAVPKGTTNYNAFIEHLKKALQEQANINKKPITVKIIGRETLDIQPHVAKTSLFSKLGSRNSTVESSVEEPEARESGLWRKIKK